jgi:hypothetical protein
MLRLTTKLHFLAAVGCALFYPLAFLGVDYSDVPEGLVPYLWAALMLKRPWSLLLFVGHLWLGAKTAYLADEDWTATESRQNAVADRAA